MKIDYLIFDDYQLKKEKTIEITQCTALSFFPKQNNLPLALIHMYPSCLRYIENIIDIYTKMYNKKTNSKLNSLVSSDFYIALHGGSDLFIDGRSLQGAQIREEYLIPYLNKTIGDKNYYKDFETLDEIYNQHKIPPKRILIPKKDNVLIIKKIYESDNDNKKRIVEETLTRKKLEEFLK